MNALRPILALAGKEIRVATVSPVLYVVGGVFLAIIGLFFERIVAFASLQSMQMLRLQGALPQLDLTTLVFQPMFRNIHVILLLVIPLLTMRLLSEERKYKTAELLMTSPVTVTQLIAGKFAAVFALYAGLLVLTLYMPVLLDVWGAVDWPTVLAGYLGLLLVGAVYLALGLLASSLTENQISAGVVALGMILGLWVIGWAALTADSEELRSLLEYLSVTHHFENFLKGLLSVTGAAYALSLASFSLFLTHRVLDSSRWR
ncbi:MAG: ABC transporter permease subunit [Nitrospirota bacterium]